MRTRLLRIAGNVMLVLSVAFFILTQIWNCVIRYPVAEHVIDLYFCEQGYAVFLNLDHSGHRFTRIDNVGDVTYDGVFDVSLYDFSISLPGMAVVSDGVHGLFLSHWILVLGALVLWCLQRCTSRENRHQK